MASFKKLSKQKPKPQIAGRDPSGLPDDLAHRTSNTSTRISKYIKIHQAQGAELNTKPKHKCHKFGRKVWLFCWHFCHWVLRGQGSPLKVTSKCSGPDFSQKCESVCRGRIVCGLQGKSTQKCVWRHSGCSACWREKRKHEALWPSPYPNSLANNRVSYQFFPTLIAFSALSLQTSLPSFLQHFLGLFLFKNCFSFSQVDLWNVLLYHSCGKWKIPLVVGQHSSSSLTSRNDKFINTALN